MEDWDVFMFEVWGEIWNRSSWYMKEKIISLKNLYSEELFEKAVKICAENDKRNYAYLNGVLKGLKNEPKSKKIDPITYLRSKKNNDGETT